MGGGLCWFDLDNDGWLDLYVVNSHATEEERLLGGGRRVAPQRALPQPGRALSPTSRPAAARTSPCAATAVWPPTSTTTAGPTSTSPPTAPTRCSGTTATAPSPTARRRPASRARVEQHGGGRRSQRRRVARSLRGRLHRFRAARFPNPVAPFPRTTTAIPDHLLLNPGSDAGGHVTFREVTTDAGLTTRRTGAGRAPQRPGPGRRSRSLHRQ